MGPEATVETAAPPQSPARPAPKDCMMAKVRRRLLRKSALLWPLPVLPALSSGLHSISWQQGLTSTVTRQAPHAGLPPANDISTFMPAVVSALRHWVAGGHVAVQPHPARASQICRPEDEREE